MNKNNDKILGASLLTAGAALSALTLQQQNVHAATIKPAQQHQTQRRQTVAAQPKVTKAKTFKASAVKSVARRQSAKSVFATTKQSRRNHKSTSSWNQYISHTKKASQRDQLSAQETATVQHHKTSGFVLGAHPYYGHKVTTLGTAPKLTEQTAPQTQLLTSNQSNNQTTNQTNAYQTPVNQSTPVAQQTVTPQSTAPTSHQASAPQAPSNPTSTSAQQAALQSSTQTSLQAAAQSSQQASVYAAQQASLQAAQQASLQSAIQSSQQAASYAAQQASLQSASQSSAQASLQASLQAAQQASTQASLQASAQHQAYVDSKTSAADNFHQTITSYAGADTRVAPWEGVHTAAVDSNGNITYYNAETDPTIHAAYETAISNWQNLGVVKFASTNDVNNASIILTDNVNGHNYDPYIQTYGNECYGATWLNNDVQGEVGNVVTVNPSAVNDDIQNNNGDVDEMTETMTHEIGHALGFAHDQYSTTGTVDQQSESYDAASDTTTVNHNVTDINLAQPIMMSGRTATEASNGLIPLGTAEKNALIQHYGANGDNPSADTNNN